MTNKRRWSLILIVACIADFAGTGLTIGKHPMEYRRAALRARNVLSSEELRYRRDGEYVRAAGLVIARQRTISIE
jgi:error-prone DNA polymerase